MKETTPAKITPAVLKFCERFGGSIKPPIYVPVRPEPDEKLLDCHNVVQRKTTRDGGAAVFGWLIWESPGLFLVSDFHSVRQSPTGELIDVNPQPDGEEKILFLRDPSMKFEGVRPKQRYMPLRDHAAVREFIAANKAYKEWFPATGVEKAIDLEGRMLRARVQAAAMAMFAAFGPKR